METRPGRSSRPQKGPNGYPEPLIVHAEGKHTQTIVILHGRGSNGYKFGTELLATPIVGFSQALHHVFAHTKFVFPTASLRRAALFKRTLITQWFDYWSLDAPSKRQELQVDGLCESSAFVHQLLKEEIELVGVGNVVLGGLSQGCATALISLLTWDGTPLPAMFGMCGWLPLRELLRDLLMYDDERADTKGDSAFDQVPFSRSSKYDPSIAAETATGLDISDLDMKSVRRHDAITALSEKLGMTIQRPMQMPFLKTPIFLAHGSEDEKVPSERGHEARNSLTSLGIDLTWKEYEGLGHRYSNNMLLHLVQFLEEKTG